MSRPMLGAAAVAALLAGAVSSASAQTITVQQVEAGISTIFPSFSPVDFFGSSPNPSVLNGTLGITSGAYPGITFFNQVPAAQVTTNTFSSHAESVARNYFGVTGTIPYVGRTAINRVFVNAAILYNTNGLIGSTPFLTNTLGVTSAAVGSLPVAIGNSVRVTNHSYVHQYSDENQNISFVRRADFLINRDNVTWTAGAVTGVQFVGGTGATTLAWRPRNGIAVRGDSTITPFDANLNSSLPTYRGRNHPDVWGTSLASFSSSEVAGYAAALIQRSNELSNTAAGDTRVIKSLIMTGASKTLVPAFIPNRQGAGGGPWIPQTGNNLDTNTGAGAVDYATSLSILNAGQRQIVQATVAGASTNSPSGAIPATSAQGWALNNLATNSQNVMLVHFAGRVTGLSSTLNWNWTSPTTGGGTQIDTSQVIAPDLSLELRPLTFANGVYTLSTALTAVAGRALSSDTTDAGLNNDNVEHIFISNATTGVINPGTYALVIRNKDTVNAVNAALSYRANVTAPPTWTGASDGATWSAALNWSTSFIPNGFSQTAVFGTSSVTGTVNVNLSATTTTVGTLNFVGPATYNINSPGTQSLSLQNANLGPAVINVSAGSHSINATVNNTGLSGSASFTGNSSLTVRTLTNNGTFGVAGAGTFTVSGSLVGTTALTGSLSLGTSALVRLNAPGGTSSYTRVLEQASVTLDGGSASTRAVLRVSGNAGTVGAPRTAGTLANVIYTSAVNIGGSGGTFFGYVDLGSSDMIVKNGAASLATLRQYVSAWYSGGSVVPQGIGSSLAGGAANPFTIAVFQNIDSSGAAFFANYDGVTGLTTNDVILKFTYKGDTNLDGTLDGNDLVNLIEGFSTGGTGWTSGDINYDGVVNAADIALYQFAAANQAAGSLGSGQGGFTSPSGAIPEPAALGVLPLVGLLASRRRRSR